MPWPLRPSPARLCAAPAATDGAWPGRTRARRRAFTLVELLVAITISSFILLGILTAYLQLLRNQMRVTHYTEMEAQVRNALEVFGLDLRSASNIAWNGTSDITLTIPSGNSTTQVTYAWTSASQNFFRVPGASSTATTGRRILVRGIPSQTNGSAGLTFARYTRDGATATSDQTTKRIVVTMNVRRQAQSMAIATENAVSASFVLRNKNPN